jgi:hypothetical protein
MDDKCAHGVLIAMYCADCELDTVFDDGWDIEWHRESRRRSMVIAVAALLAMCAIIIIAKGIR